MSMDTFEFLKVFYKKRLEIYAWYQRGRNRTLGFMLQVFRVEDKGKDP